MLEQEIKILEVNKLEIIKKLEKLGAKKTFEGFIHDIYYDFIDEENYKMEKNKRLFRVRQKGKTHLYTIKRKRKKIKDGGKKGIKIADEGEREITDIESFSKVLKKYGMTKIREKKKHRISYAFGSYEFDFDDYEGIPTVLEIEAQSKKEIIQMVELLGLENHIQKKFGSRGLYRYYEKPYFYF